MSQISKSNSSVQLPVEGVNQDQYRLQNRASAYATITISKIGLWSAVLTSICGAGYGFAVIAVLVSSLSP